MRRIYNIKKLDESKLYLSKEPDGVLGYYTFEKGKTKFFDMWRFTYISENPFKGSRYGGSDYSNLIMHINNGYITNVWEFSPEELEQVLTMQELVS